MGLLKDVIGYGTHAHRPTAGSEGRLYYETDTTTLVRDNGTTWDTLVLGSGSAGMVKLDEVIVGGGGAATIPLSSIVGTYRQLKLLITARTDVSGFAPQIHLQFNGDTGSNYAWAHVEGEHTSTGGDGAAPDTSIKIGAATGTSATANFFNSLETTIHNYASTSTTKNITSLYSRVDNLSSASSPNACLQTGCWASTSAITSILLFPDSSGNFVAGSVASLYGIS